MEEEIKMITETLQSLSGMAMWGFIIYLLAAKVFVVLACWAGGIALACILTTRIREVVYSCMKTVHITKQIRNSTGFGSGYLSESEIERVLEVLPEMIVAYKEKKQKSS